MLTPTLSFNLIYTIIYIRLNENIDDSKKKTRKELISIEYPKGFRENQEKNGKRMEHFLAGRL